MNKKSRAFISVYAMLMIFVVVVVISFVLIQVTNIRKTNAYKYNYLNAKARAYSAVQIINARKLLDDKLKQNYSGYYSLKIDELNYIFQGDIYNEDDGKIKKFSFLTYFPNNKGSYVNTTMKYKRADFFKDRVVSDKKIDEVYDEFKGNYKKIDFDECFLYSVDNSTFVCDKKKVDEKLREIEEKSSDKKQDEQPTQDETSEQGKIDDEFLKSLVVFSEKADNIIVDSNKIYIYNDIKVSGIFVDKNNIFYAKTTGDNLKIEVDGLLLLKTQTAVNYTVKGEYLSIEPATIKFTEDDSKFKTNKYEFVCSYFN